MSEPSTFGPPFNRWGTIAFEFEFMLEMIRYGRWMSDARTGESRWHDDPTCLEFAYWEEFVPEAYKEQIATMPPFGLALAKRAVNQCEDLMGMRPGMDSVFGLHHLAHAHNAEVSGDSLAGLDARGMKQASG